MRKIKIFTVLVLAVALACGAVGVSYAAKGKVKKEVSTDLTPQERFELAFYVYADAKSPLNHFAPSGWMGDSKDLYFNQSWTQNVHAGKSCIKVQYNPKGSDRWTGIYWQQPQGNWGDKEGGYDLSKATFVTFWLKGEIGNEVIQEIKIGGFKGAFPDSGTAVKKNIKLTNQWKLYFIDLRNVDTSYIAGGFSFVVSRRDNPNGCVFYMDEIRYEMEK